MYLEIQTVMDDYGRSIVCAEESNNGAIVKIGGLATLSVAGVKVDRETFKGVVLTDAIGDLYAVVAPDVTQAQRYTLVGKTEDDMTVPANEPSRCYLFHKGMRLRVEKGIVDGAVVVGDKLAPKVGTKQLQKVVTGTSVNVVATVIAVSKYRGRDCYEILFV